MITAEHLTKRYGAKTAVDDLTFEVRPGVVTGFLGPNGAGKSTTMRLMLDLDRGAGRATFDGRRFSGIRHPMREIGTVLLLSTIDALSWLRDALPYLPFAAGQLLVMTEAQVIRDDGAPLFEALSRWEGGAVFTAAIAIVLGVAWLLFKNRDA